MSESEYKELVLAAFDRAGSEDRLPQELMLPTAGSLKAEAIKVCGKRFNPKDTSVLSSFFNAESDAASYLRAIQQRDYQKFKPLSNFLNNRKKETTFKNIQLLAWLIDFKPRPFNPDLIIPADVAPQPEPIVSIPLRNDDEKDSGRNVQPVSGDDINSSTEIKNEETDVLIPLEPDERKKPDDQAGMSNKTVDKRWLIGIAALLIGGLIWWLSSGADQCMYWNNDHYVATSCNVPRLDTPLVALDRSKLRGFQRIKRVDTLTPYSVGRLWYVRIADSIEVYSAGGTHPLYPDKKLKKVTDYVVNVCHNRRN